ncbi:MAG: glycosyltransferase [Bacilli bacterium]|jgi:1,2-diacylglycerol-3-alpha-glucose alpha-1,2-glucosyltransferase
MKVFIYFQPRYLKDVYEGMRLRKNLKGACELTDIEIAKNSIDYYDVAHFISAADEMKINDSIELGKPVVFSALMCESDPSAKITETSRDGQTHLSSKAMRILNRVNLVLVPNKQSELFLKDQGVVSPIKILSPGVNISRFAKNDQIEADLFYRYFRLNKDAKTIVSFGQYDSKDEIHNVIEIAKLCPDYKFLYFGQAKRMLFLPAKIRKLLRRSPKNLRFCPIVPEDVYRSVMMNADVFLVVNRRKFNAITMLDAIAAKCQIIGFGPLEYDTKVVDKGYAYLAPTLPELAGAIKDYLSGKKPSLANKAYNIAKAESLTEIGSELKKIYSNLISNK